MTYVLARDALKGYERGIPSAHCIHALIRCIITKNLAMRMIDPAVRNLETLDDKNVNLQVTKFVLRTILSGKEVSYENWHRSARDDSGRTP